MFRFKKNCRLHNFKLIRSLKESGEIFYSSDVLKGKCFVTEKNNIFTNLSEIQILITVPKKIFKTACIDTRIKATICSTMYDMSRVAGNGYFDSEDNEEARYKARVTINNQRTEDFKAGEYKLGGGVIDPLPEDAPQFVKDYHAYYKTPRGYHKRSLNSNGGWNVTAGTSLLNTRLFYYSKEIRRFFM